jgi:adenylate cyclase
MPAASFTAAEVAARSGVDEAFVAQLAARGILVPAPEGGFTIFDVRRAGIVRAMVEGGLALDGLAQALRNRVLSLGFVEGPEYERFKGLTSETFADASARSGLPLEQLLVMREAIGLGVANAHDLIREDEEPVIAFIEAQARHGFRADAIDRLLRTMGESLRRIAEAEAAWWRSEVIEPQMARGAGPDEMGGSEISEQLSAMGEEALLAIWRAQQAHTWTANIVGGFGQVMAAAGLQTVADRPPAICFLDITGYTRLTQERGDRAAADLAGSLTRLVTRTSQHHGGRPVKWLGDGVMCHFPDPGAGVLAALDMVDGAGSTGLPPAHVGLHAGPLIIQEGDYYGQTVNMAARIADYARPGEVLVSREVVEAAAMTPQLAFTDIGPVELKGVSGVVALLSARRGP